VIVAGAITNDSMIIPHFWWIHVFYLSALLSLPIDWHSMATKFYKTIPKTIVPSFFHARYIPSVLSIPALQHNQTPTPRHFSSTTTANMSAQPFLDTMVKRRTYYALKNESPVSDARIQEIIKHTILHVPSSFNSQSSRVMLLVKAEHEKLWDIVKEVLKAVVPEDQFDATEKKLNGFRAGYGTVCECYEMSESSI
jgi:hypothetical protein